jgi:hypothetical protein
MHAIKQNNYYLLVRLAMLFLVLACMLPAAAPAQPQAQLPAPALQPRVLSIDPPRNVLFIGNSHTYYNNSVHGHVRSLAHAADPDTRKGVFKAMTISGGYLHDHAAGLPSMLKSHKWDVVVLQGQSAELLPSNPHRAERFKSALRQYDQWIRESGAKTALYMTWAYRGRLGMTGQVAHAYVAAGNEVGALVVPVGLAFERALKMQPDLALHRTDNIHPSMAGTYLTACVFYAALYGKSPAGNAYTAGLPRELADFLQKTAWDTVQAFYAAR